MPSRPSPTSILFLIAITLAGFACGYLLFHLIGSRPADRTIHLPPVTLPVP